MIDADTPYTKDEQAQIESIIKDNTTNAKPWWQVGGYESEPPSIDEFLDNPYYSGEVGPAIYPFWRKILRKIHPTPYDLPYERVLITGSTGGGKTTACIVSMLYTICCFLHRKKAERHFGFTKNEPLFIMLSNATLAGSKDTQTKRLVEFINQSPYFQDQRKKQTVYRKPSRGNTALNLPYYIEISEGSNSRHPAGKAILCALISEVNISTREEGKQAQNTITELSNRLQTRFKRKEGLSLPGMLYLDSSRKEVGGILDSYMDALKDDPKTLIITSAIWDYVKSSPKDICVSGETFDVFKGSPTRDPFIIKQSDDTILPHQIIKVPIEWKQPFEFNVREALRDFAGISVGTSGSFIGSMEVISNSLTFFNPCKPDILELNMFDESDMIIRYIDLNYVHKGPQYFVHLDLGYAKDRVGIAFTRAIGKTNIEYFDTKDGTNKLKQDFIYQTDLVICIQNRPNQQVPISRIKHFLIDMKQMGYGIAEVTFDQVASLDMEQELPKRGIPAKLLSVDRTRAPYDVLRMAMYEGRWKGPKHWVLEKEFKELIDTDKKIDHPEETPLTKGIREKMPSKDITDAVAGSVYNCSQHSSIGAANIALDMYSKEFGKQQQVKRTITGELERIRQEQDRKAWW